MANKKSIGVIGQGFVGGSLTTAFSERNVDVYVYDKAGKIAPGGKVMARDFAHQKEEQSIMKRFGVVSSGLLHLVEGCEKDTPGFSGIYFVCLPTPMNEDGSADLSIVEGVLHDLARIPGNRIAVVKSTVPPGSTERWNKELEGSGLTVIFNPEFLREATALDDMRNQTRIVLGGPRPQINKVKQLYEFSWPNVPVIKTSSSTAEMVKYVTNVHLTVKVALANELYQICEVLDKQGANIDYDKVIEYATKDERLGKSHWKVPGPMPADDSGEPAFGFGGSCIVEGEKVTMSNGVLENVENIKPGDNIQSANQFLNVLDDKVVEKKTSRLYQGEVLTFFAGNKQITCTPEHIIPVKRNDEILLVEARSIRLEDELFLVENE